MPIVRRLLAFWIVASLPSLADEALQRGNFDLAIKYLDTYLTFNADSARVHRMLGSAWFKKGDHTRAIDAYTEALRLDPTDVQAYIDRGGAYGAAGRLDAAFADLDKALKLHPNAATAYYNRALCHREKKDFDRALADFREAIRLDPKEAMFYRQRAECHAARADYAAALRDCCEALQLAPDDAATLRQRANLYHESKQYAETLADYEALLRLDSEDDNVRLLLVDLLATCPDGKLRDLTRAEKEAGRLDPNAHTSLRPYATLAALRARRGELNQAIAWQRKALACADRLDKEEKSRAAMVLKLYQTRKNKADKAAPRRAERKTPPPQGDGQ